MPHLVPNLDKSHWLCWHDRRWLAFGLGLMGPLTVIVGSISLYQAIRDLKIA
jgi:hypothetical protein